MDKFFELNPLSQLAIALCKDEKVSIVSDFKDRPREHLERLETIIRSNISTAGNFFDGLSNIQDAGKKIYEPSGISSFN